MKGNPHTEEGRRQAFELVHQQGEERITFNNFKKIATMLKLNLTEDNIQESIQTIAGKGKQHITWEQFNIFIEKKVEKRTVRY